MTAHPYQEGSPMTFAELLGPTWAARTSLLTLVAGIIGVLLIAGIAIH